MMTMIGQSQPPIQKLEPQSTSGWQISDEATYYFSFVRHALAEIERPTIHRKACFLEIPKDGSIDGIALAVMLLFL